MIEAKIKPWGNSFGIILPKELIKEKQFSKGDTIKLDVFGKKPIDGFGIWKGRKLPEFKREDLVREEFR